MPLVELLFFVIVVYLAYRFVFNFLLPIVRATHEVRRQFREMRGTGSPDSFTEGNFRTTGGGANTGSGANRGNGADRGSDGDKASRGDKHSRKPPADDYIDFEEIK